MVSLAPVQPSGCPKAIAPPLIFTLAGSRPTSRITAKACEAKASFNSTRSISFKLIPTCFNALGIAAIGPIPITLGGTPAEAQATSRPMGFNPSSFIIFSPITITKAAPSEVCDEFPAVTTPFAANTGFSFANTSIDVSALGPSSVSTV